LDDAENCNVDAETPAKNVAIVAAFKSIVVDLFCAAHRQGIPGAGRSARISMVFKPRYQFL
jgi:hypothetical protein